MGAKLTYNEILNVLIINAPGGMGSQPEIVVDRIFIEYFEQYSGSRSSVSRLLHGDARQHRNLREVYKGADGKAQLIKSAFKLLSFYPGVSARMKVYAAVKGEKSESELSVEEVAKVVGTALHEAISEIAAT